MGLPLFVDGSVLIPRPETELLVERTLGVLKGYESQSTEVLDIGTGSGNIAVALGALAPGATVVSIDISADALRVAATNVARHHLTNVTLVEADVFGEFLLDQTFDVIVSNPPYISGGEFLGLAPEVREHEPAVALTDGGSGLRVISRIIETAPVRLRPGGVLMMEHEQLAHSGFVDIEVIPDFARIPRVIHARRPQNIAGIVQS
jgi:release factor glutamine methyltransferase